ncbi:MAG: methyltransferase domain-containing protein [Deltaproteobacteria bacterium]|nr:methyltransferase domain-containing protein [Deltaproteobacteria bacterium]
MLSPQSYVHGYSSRENLRLADQADILRDLLVADVRFAPGSRVLEAGCGVGAQTITLAPHNPTCRLVCLDISPASLAQAKERAAAAALTNVEFLHGDVFAPPFAPESFDEVFVCFLLEHLADPAGALASLVKLLKPGGRLWAVEGDHGSCYYHPRHPAAEQAWAALVTVQERLGGDSLLGRRLDALLRGAGLAEVSTEPRLVYGDDGSPARREAFVGRVITPMVAGVQDQALAWGLVDPTTWEQGLAHLGSLATRPGASFSYTFFRGTGRKEG